MFEVYVHDVKIICEQLGFAFFHLSAEPVLQIRNKINRIRILQYIPRPYKLGYWKKFYFFEFFLSFFYFPVFLKKV